MGNSNFPTNWTFPRIMFAFKRYIKNRDCMRYYFWKRMFRFDGTGQIHPGPPKTECRKFLEDRGEIIINEGKNYIETVTVEQLNNIKYENWP